MDIVLGGDQCVHTKRTCVACMQEVCFGKVGYSGNCFGCGVLSGRPTGRAQCICSVWLVLLA